MFRILTMTVSVLALAALVMGCSEPTKTAKTESKKAAEKKEDDHSEWWCQEHGIPEEECSMCSKEVAAKFKKANDWCKLHDRAQSQCFKCDPTLYEKVFEPKYVAKYGKKPERPPEDEF